MSPSPSPFPFPFSSLLRFPSLLILLSFLLTPSTCFNFRNYWGGTGYKNYNHNQNMDIFRTKYSKSYHSLNEMTYRNAIFKRNLEIIDQNNDNSQSTYHMGITQFTDLTFEEFQQNILMSLEKYQNTHSKNMSVYEAYGVIKKTVGGEILSLLFPQKKSSPAGVINWKTKKVVGVIKEQGICGSCYAFSALSAIESMYMINKMSTLGVSGLFLGSTKKYTLSEQHIIDCCNVPNRCDMGCMGGYVWDALDFINKNGVYLEQNYPYRAYDETYVRKCSGIKGHFNNILNPTNPYTNVSRGNVTDLIEALKKGPVSVLIDATNMPFYVVNDTEKIVPFNNCSSWINNHAVLLVGVDDDGNWLVKNSWGEDWGHDGYITLAPGNTCGIANYAVLPNPYK